MKILYISPENTVGTLSLWKKEHEANGHECRTVTFFKSPKNFDEDICLELPFNFTKPWMAYIRNQVYKLYRGKTGYYKEKDGCPPVWGPEGWADSQFLKFKDWLWKPTVLKAIDKYNLFDFDVVHFDSGMDFLKDESFVSALYKKGKKIICHYHGEDLRSRGVMPFIDNISDLNLTNELDLLHKHPNIHYLFLPFETSQFSIKNKVSDVIRVAHSPTNRYYKGSNTIIYACKKLEEDGLIVFDLIENLSHKETLERKKLADIFIDQIGEFGGWGYGMSSIESLSMGICTLTEMNQTYQKFIPDHPFINIDSRSIISVIKSLVNDKNKIIEYGYKSRVWVKNYHDIKKVSKSLYKYYNSIGL
tara:strand:- start:300 stop:1382 length:1083 start_codon:yes stop_codon:yes gene_type:complete